MIQSKKLIDSLHYGDFHERWDVVKDIPKLGNTVISDLIDLLNDDDLDEEGRWFVIRSLGYFDRPEVISSLLKVLTTTDDEALQGAVGEALTRIGTTAVVALSELLQHPQHRAMAVHALAKIHHPATISPLLLVVNDADATLRAKAIEALGCFGDLEVLPVLVTALDDRAAQVRLAAIAALASLRPYLQPIDLLGWLLPRLWDGHLEVSQQTIHTLGRLGLAESTQALLTLLHTPTTPQASQIAIIQALGWQGTSAALGGLIKAWSIEDGVVRLAVVRAIGMLSSPELLGLVNQTLVEWLAQLPTTEANSPLRRELVFALGKIGGQTTVDEVRSLLTDPDESVRCHAEAALECLINRHKLDPGKAFGNC